MGLINHDKPTYNWGGTHCMTWLIQLSLHISSQSSMKAEALSTVHERIAEVLGLVCSIRLRGSKVHLKA